MSQSHCGGFSVYSEISPSLNTAGAWHGLGSLWQNCLFTPKCHNIGIWSSVCFLCTFFEELSQLHMEGAKPRCPGKQ